MNDETQQNEEESLTFKALAEQELRSTLGRTEQNPFESDARSKDPTVFGPTADEIVPVEEDEEVEEVAEEDVEKEEDDVEEEDEDGDADEGSSESESER